MKTLSHKRIFLGIVPPQDVIHTLRRSVASYKNEKWAGEVKWVKPVNLHLTLKFVGNVAVGELETLVSTAETAISSFGSFEIGITGLKIFPKPSRPSVICAGTGKNLPLLTLAKTIEDSLAGDGSPIEKRGFKGHITLGRCKKSFPRKQKIYDIIEATSFSANEIIIFQSILRPNGPEYRVEKKIRLG